MILSSFLPESLEGIAMGLFAAGILSDLKYLLCVIEKHKRRHKNIFVCELMVLC